MPSESEYAEALGNLEKHQYRVDYVITHTAPKSLMCLFHPKRDDKRELNLFLQGIMDKAQYRHWYFAHLHEDHIIDDKYRALYQDVLLLGDDRDIYETNCACPFH